MPNPFNPLEWLKSAQDWFAKTEKSSGFRPFLIFFLLCVGAGLVLLFSFQTNALIQAFALGLMGITAAAFIVMFAWKSERDPDFCRSETHVQKIRKYELEVMGSESKQIEADVLDAASHLASAVTPRALPNERKGERA